MALNKEDYQEPCCPFDTSQWKQEEPAERIDIRRITEKLDSFFYNRDYPGAKRLLFYWLDCARSLKDRQGELAMENELMGLTRKLGLGDEAESHAENALKLAGEPGLENSTAAATTFINAGTVFKAFGDAGRAVGLFEKARDIYERQLLSSDSRLGGLYNNYALALTDLSRFEEAMEYYRKALAVMKQVQNGDADAAITWLNMANCKETESGLENALPFIEEAVENAWNALNSEQPAHNGYYRFVCEKCIPTFEYYGYFGYAEELKSRL